VGVPVNTAVVPGAGQARLAVFFGLGVVSVLYQVAASLVILRFFLGFFFEERSIERVRILDSILLISVVRKHLSDVYSQATCNEKNQNFHF
jgi:hypothetical protein